MAKTYRHTATNGSCLLMACLTTTVVLAILHTSTARAEGVLKQGDALCTMNGDGGCVVEFNLAAAGSAYFRVQRLDALDGSWTSVGDHGQPWQDGDTVEGGHLYRVVGCNDPDGTRGCSHSRVFWAPAMPAEADIPSQVAVADGEGGEVWAAITGTEPRAEQLRQLNVYLLSDLLTDVGGVPGARMTEPAEHSHAAGFPHDENMIHHDVYQQFNLLQERLLDDAE